VSGRGSWTWPSTKKNGWTAAEVSFDTEAGKNYQLQSINTITGGWKNIGSPIVGTGGNMSYVTPTRANTHQYYRVMKLD
jgi:hypothetical protein